MKPVFPVVIVTRVTILLVKAHHSIRTETMPKAKVKICVRSSAGARPPKCYAVGTVVCPPCVVALETYRRVKALKAEKRAESNRASAERSRQKKEQKRSDIYSDHLALTAEHEELVQEMANINHASQVLAAAIALKSEERDGLAYAKSLKLASQIVHQPK